MSYSVSNDFKTQLNELVQEYRAYIEFDDGTFIYDSTHLQTIKLHNNLQNNNKRLFGNAIVKYAEIEIQNPNNNTYNDLVDKYVDIYMGLTLPTSAIEYVPMGKFLVLTVEKDTVNERIKITAFDDMILFNQEYDYSATFPATLGELAQYYCDQVGVVLATPTFQNSTYTIDGETLAYKPSYRELLSAIAELSITNISIGRDGQLYIQPYGSSSVYDLTTNDSFEIEIKDAYGPVNVVSLENDPGDLVYRPSTLPTTITEVKFLNNELATNQESDQRNDVIDNMYTLVNGFENIPYHVKFRSPLYLDILDAIVLYDGDDNPYNAYVMNQVIEYNGAIIENMTSENYSQTESDYKYGKNVKDAFSTTTIKIDKATGEIQILAETTQDIIDYVDSAVSDDCMTVDEKNTTSRVWEGIKKEYDRLVEEANKTIWVDDVETPLYDLDTQLTEYENAYEQLRYIMEDEFLIDDRTEKTCPGEGSGETLRTALSDYMGRKQDLQDGMGSSSASNTWTNYSQITVNANGIEQKVGYNDVVSSINQTAEEITINANRIGLLGEANIPDIKGKEITLGEGQGEGGLLEVYNENDNLIVELNSTGMKFQGYDAGNNKSSYFLITPQELAAYLADETTRIFWINEDEFRMKKAVVEEEISIAFQIRMLAINDGTNIGLAFVASTTSTGTYIEGDAY